MDSLDLINSFDRFSTKEMYNILYSVYTKEEVIAKYEIETEDDYDSLIEHLFGWFWKRRVDASPNLTWELIEEMYLLYDHLKIDVLGYVDQFIGEAAISNKLDKDTLEKAKSKIELDWAKDQIYLREKLNYWANNREDETYLLNLLLETKHAWPIFQVIRYISSKGLTDLRDYIENNKLFSKNYRHHIRQEIKLELKRRNSSSK